LKIRIIFSGGKRAKEIMVRIRRTQKRSTRLHTGFLRPLSSFKCPHGIRWTKPMVLAFNFEWSKAER
jgi:hypothetical protein